MRGKQHKLNRRRRQNKVPSCYSLVYLRAGAAAKVSAQLRHVQTAVLLNRIASESNGWIASRENNDFRPLT